MDITLQPQPWQVQLPWRSCPTRPSAQRCVSKHMMTSWGGPAWLWHVRAALRPHGRVELPSPPAAMLNRALIHANPPLIQGLRAAATDFVLCCTLISGRHSPNLCCLMRPYLFGKTVVEFNAAALPETSRKLAFKWSVGVCRQRDAGVCHPPPARPHDLPLTDLRACACADYSRSQRGRARRCCHRRSHHPHPGCRPRRRPV